MLHRNGIDFSLFILILHFNSVPAFFCQKKLGLIEIGHSGIYMVNDHKLDYYWNNIILLYSNHCSYFFWLTIANITSNSGFAS